MHQGGASSSGSAPAADPPPAAGALRLPVLIAGVIAAGALSFGLALAEVTSASLPSLWALALAALLFVAGDVALLHIRFGHNQHSFTWSETAMVIGLMILPSPWLRLVAPLAVLAAHAVARRGALKVAFNTASIATEAFLALTVFGLVADDRAAAGDPRTWLALGLAALSFFVWNGVTVSAAVALSENLPFGAVYRKGLLLNALVAMGNTGTGILLVATSASASPAVLVVVPLLVALLYLEYRSYLRAMNERDTWKVLQVTSSELLRMEPAEVAQVVLERTPTLFQADLVDLMVVDGEPGTSAALFRWSGAGGAERHDGRPEELAAAFWPRALCDREPFELVARTAAAPQRAELDALGLASCVVAPLLTARGCLGVLRIGFRQRVPFRTRDMQVFSTFANHVGSALHNTRLFEEMRTHALHDPLTGLPNRTLLLDRLAQAQARLGRSSKGVAVLFCDLDRFKVINDSLGHEVGDQLLVAVADRLRTNLRPGDTATRFGGDEFVVLCPDVRDEHQALEIAERLAVVLSAPFPLGQDPLYVSVSIGLAVTRDADADPTALLRDADAAMYQAKDDGRARCALFDNTMRERAVARLEMENDLRRALDRGELQLHYQPTIRMRDGRATGVEALVRWGHPERGLVAPNDFIPLAEETGQIKLLGAWVLREACAQLESWIATGLVGPDFSMAVNLSPHQLTAPGLVDQFAAVLEMSAIAPRQLCVEITESALVGDAEGAAQVLRDLRRLGVRIALDDFGTGYSALSYLHLLPVDDLKIDRSFVARLGPDPQGEAIVSGLIDLAHTLGLTVVAEGVETEGQAAMLEAMGCDVAQGYHYGRPEPAALTEPALRRIVPPCRELVLDALAG